MGISETNMQPSFRDNSTEDWTRQSGWSNSGLIQNRADIAEYVEARCMQTQEGPMNQTIHPGASKHSGSGCKPDRLRAIAL